MFLARHPTFLFCLGEYYYYQWLVFRKTTAYFSQNDGLFFAKRRLVFHKTTACFLQNDVSFLGNLMKGEEAR